jgi:hypothetical protein
MASTVKSAMKLETGKVWIEKVRFKVSPNLNNNSPVSVHLIAVYRQDLMDELSKMTAFQYFNEIPKIKRSYSESSLKIFSFDIVPGQRLEDQNVLPDRTSSALGAFIFVRYSNDGEHRVQLGEERFLLVELGKLDFSVKEISS